MSADELYARLLALEAEVQALKRSQSPTPEETSATYLTMDPVTKKIGADFTGHVHAQGLDLDAGDVTTPPDVDRIRWLRTSDKAVVADIYGTETPLGIDFLVLDANASAPTLQSGVLLQAKDALGGIAATLNVAGAGAAFPASSKIALAARNATRTLLDGNGASSFLQTPLTAQTASWGAVLTGNAPTIVNSGSGDWTVSGGFGAGVAVVSFNTAKATVPTVLHGIQGNAAGGPFTSEQAPAVANVTLTTYSAGVLANLAVTFLAIG